MKVAIDQAYQDLVRAWVASGRFADETEVVNAALGQMLERERLLAAIDEGLADFENGDYTSYGPNDRQRLIDDIRAESERIRDERVVP